jgi:hypothetical protein
MKKLFYLPAIMLSLLAMTFTSCEKDETDPEPEPEPQVTEAVTGEITLDVSDYSKWIYFSFEEGAKVAESAVLESRDELDWDLAFQRYNVRSNSGESGSGEGGILAADGKIGKEGWDALIEAPEEGYTEDKIISVMTEFAMPPVYEDVPGNNVLTGGTEGTGILFSMETYAYSATNQIFVVKTAEGNYAKVWLTDFYNDDSESGHLTFKYCYQTDGSTNLK